MPAGDFSRAKCKSRLCHWDLCKAKRETAPVRDFCEAKWESRLRHWDFCQAKWKRKLVGDFCTAKCESFGPDAPRGKALPRVIRKRLSERTQFVESELFLPGKFVLFIGLLFLPGGVMNVSRPENGPPPRAGKAAGLGRNPP